MLATGAVPLAVRAAVSVALTMGTLHVGQSPAVVATAPHFVHTKTMAAVGDATDATGAATSAQLPDMAEGHPAQGSSVEAERPLCTSPAGAAPQVWPSDGTASTNNR